MVTLLALRLKNRGDVLGERHWLVGRTCGDRWVGEHQESTETEHDRSDPRPHRTLELGIDHDMLLSLVGRLLPIYAILAWIFSLSSQVPPLYTPSRNPS